MKKNIQEPNGLHLSVDQKHIFQRRTAAQRVGLRETNFVVILMSSGQQYTKSIAGFWEKVP